MTKQRKHAVELASHGGYDEIVAVGGDGTVHEVVNGIMISGSDPLLTVVPAGTGNDFSRNIGTGARKIDIGKIELDDRTEWFVNTMGFGFASAVVSETYGKKTGKTAYLLSAIKNLVKYGSEYARLDIDGKYIEEDLFQIDICNGMFYGNGMKVSPESKIDDGFLDIVLTKRIPTMKAFSTIPMIYKGTHIKNGISKSTKAKEIEIVSEHLLHADGEIVGESPAVVSIVPRAISARTMKI